MSSPPILFPGAAWRAVGVHRRYGHDLDLFVLDGDATGYAAAYRAHREAMICAGFSWTRFGHADGVNGACWWAIAPLDGVDVDALRDAALATAVEAVAERAEREEEYAAWVAGQALAATLADAPIRAALARIARETPWALGRLHGVALSLVAAVSWTDRQARKAAALVDGAAANRARADARLARPGPVTWTGRAADPDVAVAALEACRLLSSLDDDWAADRNGRGWSQTTCWSGHALSERERLDATATAHALHVLHGHRAQLPADLRGRLFGAPAPAPTAPADEAPRLDV